MMSILKTDPREISIRDYHYDLPDERIAKYPAEIRDSSQLLIWNEGVITADRFSNICRYLPPSSLLVFNDTRVIEARIFFTTAAGEKVEVFLLNPVDGRSDPLTVMHGRSSVRWYCLVGRANKWKEKVLHAVSEDVVLHAELIGRDAAGFIVELSWSPPEMIFADILHRYGVMPLPPYLHRQSEPGDEERYQTVYASKAGSVAAPTAGLHFTQDLLQQLKENGIQQAAVTLHVGAGTFKPVNAAQMKDHVMHAELIDVTDDFIFLLIEEDKPVIAVGTTSCRTLESLYWMGVKAMHNPDASNAELEISQWDVYNDVKQHVNKKDALLALHKWMIKQNIKRILAHTQIIIAPGYRFRICDALITNFHQPGSTLLLLVAAITGSEWRVIYNYALENNFRFLSYGDSSLLFINRWL